MTALSVEAFGQLAEQGLTIVDIRDTAILKQGFVKGSISLCSPSIFGVYLGFFSGFSLSSGPTPLLLVGEPSQNLEPFLKALPDGSGDRIKGYLQGGFEAWEKAGEPVDMIIDVEADELMMDIPFDDNLVVMDIRPAISFGDGHLKDAVSLPLAQMQDP
ncbi:rhodanese-like domain-containing protein [Niabella sp. W65]|nr:rhodanese-like domain-containing protein [Niabella sp. W65]MCH7368404.1 rhodanese-like domain-containing protein [Niabella sp. W65]ULT44002.1 rhodanese-like domain-containing protein [Niabella sp. I65]